MASWIPVQRVCTSNPGVENCLASYWCDQITLRCWNTGCICAPGKVLQHSIVVYSTKSYFNKWQILWLITWADYGERWSVVFLLVMCVLLQRRGSACLLDPVGAQLWEANTWGGCGYVTLAIYRKYAEMQLCQIKDLKKKCCFLHFFLHKSSHPISWLICRNSMVNI